MNEQCRTVIFVWFVKRMSSWLVNEIDNPRVGRRGLTNRFIRAGNISRVSGPTRFIRSSIGIALARRRVAAAPRSRQNARRGFNRN